jgi:hypothetical protein
MSDLARPGVHRFDASARLLLSSVIDAVAARFTLIDAIPYDSPYDPS